MDKAIVSREFSIPDLAAEGLSRYFRNFKDILLVYLCTVLPANLAATLISAAATLLFRIPISDSDTRATVSLFLCSGTAVLSLITAILSSVAQLWAVLAVAKLVEDDIQDRKQGWQETLRMTLHRLWSAVGTSILMGLCLFGLSLLLVIPGIMYSIYWIFTPYVVALRGTGGKQAMDYSNHLVNDRWWRTFFALFLFAVVSFLFIVPVMLGSALFLAIPFSGFLTNTLLQIVAAIPTVMLVVYFLNLDYCSSGAPSPDKPKSLAELMGTGSPALPVADAPEMPRFKLPDPPA